MKRQQFNDILLRAAKDSSSKLIIIGSQAFFAATNSEDIPEIVSISDEVDIFPETGSDAELIECRIGKRSGYFEKYGIYAHALEDVDRHMLTRGWRNRLVPYIIKDESQGGREYEVSCLSLPDICVNKLCFGRHKDYEFVSEAVEKRFINFEDIEALADSVQERYKGILKKNIDRAKSFSKDIPEDNGISI